MSAYQAARSHHDAVKLRARSAAVKTLAQHGIEVRLTNYNRGTAEAVRDQWGGSRWDWDEVFQKYRGLKGLDLAAWTHDGRLVALGVATLSSVAVTVRMVEGDRRDDCPLRGRRALIMLEAATNFALGTGRTEIRVEPLNEQLAQLYQAKYGFTLVTPDRGEPYYVRKI